MPTYFNWPAQSDVQLLLDSANVVLRLDDFAASNRIGLAIDQVIEEVGHRTLRQFITSAETRTFDGSGTPEQIVDEMVALDQVQAFTSALDSVGTAFPYAQLVREPGRPLTRIINVRGLSWQAWPMTFPRGRQNVAVTGTWGYAPEIPADLWSAVCGEIAFRLTRELCFRPIGRVKEYRTTAATITYQLDNPAVTGWNVEFKRALVRYKRPEAYRNRYLRGRMQ